MRKTLSHLPHVDYFPLAPHLRPDLFYSSYTIRNHVYILNSIRSVSVYIFIVVECPARLYTFNYNFGAVILLHTSKQVCGSTYVTPDLT